MYTDRPSSTFELVSCGLSTFLFVESETSCDVVMITALQEEATGFIHQNYL